MTASLVLYLHPWGHLNDLVVPAGAVACMNAIPPPKRGRYAFEVRDDEIREARVVCIDLHWAIGLTGFERLVRHVRSVAPSVPIVVGGIAASHVAEELLASLPVDYVIRGDAETSFAALVAALREGRLPGAIPNVLARGERRPPHRRMDARAFDDTDSVCLEWFPTLERAADLDAVAFPPGRTIVVARGCPMRCPTCYGSHAETFGAGTLWRSPERTAALLREAERVGARNVRLIVGKPSSGQLSALLAALAASGPYRFTSAVGIYLCRAPSDDEIASLEAAFDCEVHLSVVPPDEHAPALSPERLADESAAWRRVAARVARSPRVRLDVWATSLRDLEALRAELGAIDDRHVQVSSGAVWSMSRPGDGTTSTLDAVRSAVESLWTFYAARLLSPTLARMLAPFRFLDEVGEGLDALPRPDDPALAVLHDVVQRAWAAHRLPTLRGLEFDAVPVSLGRTSTARTPPDRAGATVHRGDLCVTRSATPPTPLAPIPLEATMDHRGVSLEASLRERPPCDGLAIVPRGMGGTSAAWLATLARDGLAVLRVPPGATGALRLRVDLRVQDARVFLLDAEDRAPPRGVADLGYFRDPRPVSSHARPRGHAPRDRS